MRLLYDIGFLLFAVFYLPVFFLKGKHRGGFLERFGILSAEVKRSLSGKKVVWVHAVSVGEAVQGARLIQALGERLFGYHFVLTVTTAAGRGVAQKLLKENAVVLYFPADFRACVRSFVRQISPRAVIVLETEIWPNLVYELSERRIPVSIVNGRISDRAIGRYRAVRNFVKPVLNRFSAIAVQDAAMKARFVELGASPALVFVTGSMKFDWKPSAGPASAARSVETYFAEPDRFLLVAGSTHRGEEEILFDAAKGLTERFPQFRLLIAPRHLDRLAAIEAAAAKRGVPAKRVGSLGAEKGSDCRWEKGTVLLLDQMGVLADLYQAADAVFVGGSLLPGYGGHNLVEPAYFEKPVLVGPYADDFREMVAAFKRGGACVEVRDSGSLVRELSSLIGDRERRLALGSAAKRIVEQHQGATRKNVEALLASMNF
jgi:3-deoxy-D-manno-octulosonic-acid transferase